MKIQAVDPDVDKVDIARRALGPAALVAQGRAPELAPINGPVDLFLMIDMLHYLDDDQVPRTLQRASELLAAGGRIVIRATVPSDKWFPWERLLEQLRLNLSGTRCSFRSSATLKALLFQAGFVLDGEFPAVDGREETWFTATLR